MLSDGCGRALAHSEDGLLACREAFTLWGAADVPASAYAVMPPYPTLHAFSLAGLAEHPSFSAPPLLAYAAPLGTAGATLPLAMFQFYCLGLRYMLTFRLPAGTPPTQSAVQEI